MNRLLNGINTLNRRINSLTGGEKEKLATPRKFRKDLMESLQRESLSQSVRVIEGVDVESDAVTEQEAVIEEDGAPLSNPELGLMVKNN